MTNPDLAAVDLYWLPLGAGGRSVRLNGRAFEAVASRVERRPARDLYHSALEVRLAAERFVIEMAPASGGQTTPRGVVAQGPVGTRRAGRLRNGAASGQGERPAAHGGPLLETPRAAATT